MEGTKGGFFWGVEVSWRGARVLGRSWGGPDHDGGEGGDGRALWMTLRGCGPGTMS